MPLVRDVVGSHQRLLAAARSPSPQHRHARGERATPQRRGDVDAMLQPSSPVVCASPQRWQSSQGANERAASVRATPQKPKADSRQFSPSVECAASPQRWLGRKGTNPPELDATCRSPQVTAFAQLAHAHRPQLPQHVTQHSTLPPAAVRAAASPQRRQVHQDVHSQKAEAAPTKLAASEIVASHQHLHGRQDPLPLKAHADRTQPLTVADVDTSPEQSLSPSGGRWEWQYTHLGSKNSAGPEDWRPMWPPAQHEIEVLFQEFNFQWNTGRHEAVPHVIQLGTTLYRIDFTKMHQTNLKTGKERLLRRVQVCDDNRTKLQEKDERIKELEFQLQVEKEGRQELNQELKDAHIKMEKMVQTQESQIQVKDSRIKVFEVQLQTVSDRCDQLSSHMHRQKEAFRQEKEDLELHLQNSQNEVKHKDESLKELQLLLRQKNDSIEELQLQARTDHDRNEKLLQEIDQKLDAAHEGLTVKNEQIEYLFTANELCIQQLDENRARTEKKNKQSQTGEGHSDALAQEVANKPEVSQETMDSNRENVIGCSMREKVKAMVKEIAARRNFKSQEAAELASAVRRREASSLCKRSASPRNKDGTGAAEWWPFYSVDMQQLTKKLQTILQDVSGSSEDCRCDQLNSVTVVRVEQNANWQLIRHYTHEKQLMREEQSRRGIAVKSLCPGALPTVQLKQDFPGLHLDPDVGEELLFYGTSGSNLGRVLQYGFDEQLDSRESAGDGIYFTDTACRLFQPTSSASKGSEHTGCIVLARVALGDSRYIACGQGVAAGDVCYDASKGTCDSFVVGAERGPRQFVVRNGKHACPDLAIYYKVSV